ncbi:MAG TPA: ERAP1-like C-terminal domain-containing protein, partial [Vicinamibacterales bacterium]
GVPVEAVTLRCDTGSPQLTVTSDRFFTDPAMAKVMRSTPSWQVPLCTKTPSGTSGCQVVGGPQATVPAGTTSCPRWAFVNAGAYGYFRAAYSPEMLRALAPDMASSFSEPERLTIVGDEWALVRAGRHSVADYLTLATGFGQEHTNGVLAEVSARLMFVHDYLTGGDSRQKYEQFVRSLFGPLYRELGINAAPGDDDDKRALRATVIQTVDLAGNDPGLAIEARSALEQSLSGGGAMEASAAKAVAAVAARHGNTALFDELLNASQRAASPAERYRYLYALGAFEDPALIDRGLNFALTPDLRSQDAPTFIGAFLANPVARPRTWTFVKQHWDQVGPKTTIAGGDVRLVESLGAFCDARSRDDIKDFFKAHKLPAASRALEQTLERINNCIAMKDKGSAAVAAWLAARP